MGRREYRRVLPGRGFQEWLRDEIVASGNGKPAGFCLSGRWGPLHLGESGVFCLKHPCASVQKSHAPPP